MESKSVTPGAGPTDPYNSPITTTDAASMLRVRVNPNMKPYTKAIVLANNKLVDDWEFRVLKEISNSSGTVPASKVWPCWQSYIEGVQIRETKNLIESGMITMPNEKVVDFWRDTFERMTIEELHKMGGGSVGYGWNVIQTYIRLWLVERKWELIYSKSNNPLSWHKESIGHTNLQKGTILPFWDPETLKLITEKVLYVTNIQVKPEN